MSRDTSEQAPHPPEGLPPALVTGGQPALGGEGVQFPTGPPAR